MGRIERISEGATELRVQYDSRGLPKQINTSDGSCDFAYDASGRMVSAECGKQKLLFLPDPLSNADLPLLAADDNGHVEWRTY